MRDNMRSRSRRFAAPGTKRAPNAAHGRANRAAIAAEREAKFRAVAQSTRPATRSE